MDGKAEAERSVGMDVAKARVDVHVRPDGGAFGGTTDPEVPAADILVHQEPAGLEDERLDHKIAAVER